MMIKDNIKIKNTFIIKLENGDDILKGLKREIKEAEIENGIIVNGIGSTSSYHIHVVKSVDLPPEELYKKENAPFDVVNMQGYIMDGEIHAHISMADANDCSQYGGHLEEGCKVLTFCIITILETTLIDKLDDF